MMGEDDGSRFARAIRDEIDQVEDALQGFRRGQFVKAERAFTRLAANTAHEARAQGYRLLAGVASTYRKTAPKAPWDGAIVLEEK